MSTTPLTVYHAVKIQPEPSPYGPRGFVLDRRHPRLALGMGQLIDPQGRRNVIGTAVWCMDHCAENDGWSWERI
jgi:hypothetical protein